MLSKNDIFDSVRKIFLYPEYISFGRKSLSDIMKKDFVKALKMFGIEDTNFIEGMKHYSRIELNGKSSQIYIAKHERLFLTDYWKDGVCLAHAKIKRKFDAAMSVADWVAKDWSFKKFSQEYPFVEFSEGSYEFEKGTEIEYAWKRYLSYIPKYEPKLLEFVMLAVKDEILSNLFPYMSMNTFCFSRCTGYPYSYDCPFVESKHNEIIVHSYNGDILGKTNVQDAIRIIKENLPKNCGRAIKGTREDL